MSQGELHASKWCRRTKDHRLRKEKKKRGRNLTKIDRYLQGKRGVPTTGKFRLVAGNTIRAEARYNHRLKSRRSPVNFSGSRRGFRFRGGSKGSAGPSGLMWITGFGEGFCVNSGVFWACLMAAIFIDYSWILSKIWSAGVFCARFKAVISNNYSWILSRIYWRILFLGPCPP